VILHAPASEIKKIPPMIIAQLKELLQFEQLELPPDVTVMLRKKLKI